ncbi:MAG: SPOR domain-containing protein [Bacteroidales bacterium]|jgi:cell division protein FtsN|nr:SPOR domain-containing protein [Bacteroidales bacterium]
MSPVRYRQRPVTPKNTEKPEKSTSKKNTGTIIIVLLLGIGIGITIGILFDPIKKIFVKPAVEETIIITPAPLPESEPEEINEEVQPEPEPVAQPVAVTHKQESSSSVPTGFYIIIGSYHQRYSAEQLVSAVEKDIEANVLHFKELGLYRVSVGKYDRLNKAYNDLSSIKDLDGCEEAWVLENR